MRTAQLPVADRTLVRNIVRTFKAASADEVTEGREWYSQAWRLALEVDPLHPLRAAGIIAALSPLTPWDRNVWLVRQLYVDGTLESGTLGANRAKANRIMAGEDPLLVLSGAKVRAFFSGIVSQGASSDVCVDRHAYDLAVGRRYGNSDRPGLQSQDGYRRIADAYVRAAKRLGVGPQELQAITWVAWRNAA